MKLIDKAVVVAKIERRVKSLNMDRDFNYLQIKELEALLSSLDTLEVKDVDEEYNGKAMLHILEKGVKQGKRETLNKVCEWLLNNVRYYSTNALGAEYMCEDLRKTMEE